MFHTPSDKLISLLENLVDDSFRRVKKSADNCIDENEKHHDGLYDDFKDNH
jgi:hypothetical protein